jgi:hypothetical protein
MKPVLYIAGPMSGLPEFNYPAFFAAEEQLRAAGYDRILNPARAVCPVGSEWDVYMRSALVMVTQAEALALLPGHQNSRGARLERHVAEALGMPVAPLEHWLTPDPTCCGHQHAGPELGGICVGCACGVRS